MVCAMRVLEGEYNMVFALVATLRVKKGCTLNDINNEVIRRNCINRPHFK